MLAVTHVLHPSSQQRDRRWLSGSQGAFAEAAARVRRSVSTSAPAPVKKEQPYAKLTGGSKLMLREDVLDFFRSLGFTLTAADVRPQMANTYKQVSAWFIKMNNEDELRGALQLQNAYIVRPRALCWRGASPLSPGRGAGSTTALALRGSVTSCSLWARAKVQQGGAAAVAERALWRLPLSTSLLQG